MLRMRIIRDGDFRPRQYATPAGPVDTAPPWYEVREPQDPTPLELELCNRPFDLTAEDPVRAVLVPDGDDPHLAHLLLVVHHAAADGYSLKLLAEDLWSLYTALARGEEVGVEDGVGVEDEDESNSEPFLPRAEFADYLAAVSAERRSPAFTRDQRYWRDRLAEHTPATPTTPDSLPYDGAPEASLAPPLTHHRTRVDEVLTAALRETAARNGVSLFHLLLAVYGRCLSRWSGRRAVAVNVARARRELPIVGIDRLVGPLADILPVFVDVDPVEPVATLADRLRRIWREAESHATLSSPDFARLLSQLHPATGPAPRTVAEAGFSFARFPVAHGPDWPVTVTPTAAATASAATRLGLLCWEADAALRLSWNYPARLFRPETVRRLADEYVSELRAAVTHPSAHPIPAPHPSTGPVSTANATEPAEPAELMESTDTTGTAENAGGAGRAGAAGSAVGAGIADGSGEGTAAGSSPVCVPGSAPLPSPSQSPPAARPRSPTPPSTPRPPPSPPGCAPTAYAPVTWSDCSPNPAARTPSPRSWASCGRAPAGYRWTPPTPPPGTGSSWLAPEFASWSATRRPTRRPPAWPASPGSPWPDPPTPRRSPARRPPPSIPTPPPTPRPSPTSSSLPVRRAVPKPSPSPTGRWRTTSTGRWPPSVTARGTGSHRPRRSVSTPPYGSCWPRC